MRAPVVPETRFATYLMVVLMLIDVGSDVNVMLTLLLARSYVCVSFLMWVFWMSLFSETASGGLWWLRRDMATAIKRGVKTDRQLDMTDTENGFEGFAALLVTVVGLLDAMRTPFQFVSGIFSMFSSAYGLSGYIFREADLQD
eukprot:UN1561